MDTTHCFNRNTYSTLFPRPIIFKTFIRSISKGFHRSKKNSFMNHSGVDGTKLSLSSMWCQCDLAVLIWLKPRHSMYDVWSIYLHLGSLEGKCTVVKYTPTSPKLVRIFVLFAKDRTLADAEWLLFASLSTESLVTTLWH